ncbi:MAG: hypothetical protein LBS03_08985 [Bacteroidales bacterium]|jgi:hypothetical protein|nr:hypothetical protein [Bacteroidales bacterium]
MKKIIHLFIAAGLTVLTACDRDNEAPEETYEPFFEVPETVHKNNTAGQGYGISVTASDDVSWSASVPPSDTWITLVSASGKGNGQAVFHLTANTGFTERQATVTFTATSDKVSTATFEHVVCLVRQIGQAPAIIIMPSGTQQLSSDAVANYTIDVVSNVEWTVQVENDANGWITVVSPATSMTGDGQAKLNIAENLLRNAHSGKISIVSTEDAELKQELTIEQAGKVYTIAVAPDGNIPITSAARQVTVTVTSNDTWEVAVELDPNDEAGWLAVASPGTASTGDGNIVLNVSENTTGQSRVATIVIRSTQFEDVSQTVTLTQQAPGVVYTFAIPGFTGSAAAGSATMNVSGASGTSDLPVTVNDDGSTTTISFTDLLEAGDYIVVSLQYESSPTVPLGAKITVDAAGNVVYTEHWDTVFECFGGDSEERPLYISSTTVLEQLRDAVNDGTSFAGLYLTQTANISIASDNNWIPIGNASGNPFAGIYDGANFKISGIKISSATDGYALFGYIGGTDENQEAVIKNLTVEGSGAITDIEATAANGTGAGIVAYVNAHTVISNCTNNANVSGGRTTTGYAGGCIAVCTGTNITISGCANHGNITGSSGSFGGIVSYVAGTTGEKTVISNCANHGDITVTAASNPTVGGIAGRAVNPAGAEILRCSNHGDITLTVNSTAGTGGIIGALVGTSSVSESFNLGNIDAFTNTGGISGLMHNNAAIYNCYNKGNITYGTSTAVNNSGIAGNMTNAKARPVEYCYNAGIASTPGTGNKNWGGIAASNGLTNYSDLTAVKDCFYETATGYDGGIGGNKYPPTDVLGSAEGKTAAEMKSGTPYTSGWDTSIWQFTAGSYPSLINNPE